MKNSAKTKPTQGELRRILAYVRPHRTYLLLGLLLALVQISLSLYAPVLTGRGVDLMIGKGRVDFDALWPILIRLAAVILLAAGVLWLCFGHPAAGSGLVAVLTYGDDSTQLRIPLDTDHRYDIDTGYYTIHLVVENGGIRFVESPCPDHTCESFGVLTKQGDWAACLPARASVTVE